MKKHLPILDVKAAFVDVGSEHMHVSVGGDEPKVFLISDMPQQAPSGGGGQA